MARKRNAYKELPVPKNTKFNESLRRNGNTYYFWFYRMAEIYMNRVKFINLPSTIDIPTMMWGLLTNGNVAYFTDEIMGDLCLAGVPERQVDVYNYQTGYFINTASGYSRHLAVSRFNPERNGVVIYTNYSRNADIMILMEYAERLYDALRTCDVNVNLQKTAKIIGTSEAQRLTLVNLLKDYSGNVPLILTDKEMRLGTAENPVYDMTTPYVADKIWTYICNIWNDFLTWLGIENATNQKRERLVSDEVNANYGAVEMERNVSLGMMQKCFDEVNELFGRNIKVEFNSSLNTQLNVAFTGEEFMEEEEENGNLYSETE